MVEIPRMKSGENLKRIMDQNYLDGHVQAQAGKFVVWIAIGVPIELLKGFDIVIAVPENHAAMCAARAMGPLLAEKAESAGYSMDLCSYARIDLGTVFARGKDSPSRGLPGPHLLISDNNHCSHLVKWFDVHHREMKIPHFILDVPFCYEPQKAKDLDYIISQYQDLVSFIQDRTSQKFDIDKVREAIVHTREGITQWKRFLSFAAHRPSGITAFDSFLHMAPYITSYRGTQTLVEHYKQLADEVESRVASNMFPVPNEKYRLFWDNIAPWHQLNRMSARLADFQANIIYAYYTAVMGSLEGDIDMYPFDGADSFVTLARIQNGTLCPYGLELRVKAMSKAIERLGVDGIVFSSNRSCKPYSLMQLDIQKRLSSRFGIPSVMIDVDHADARKYNEAQALMRIEALLEMIDARRQC
jgi:benzoyl-CoA reductase/2-hydroxyglutaryl-CoA dehydratase subunit BcrC/BadD/HgdB